MQSAAYNGTSRLIRKICCIDLGRAGLYLTAP